MYKKKKPPKYCIIIKNNYTTIEHDFYLDIFEFFAILSIVMTALAPYLPYIQIILAVLITASVLLQSSEASAGGTFGGTDNWNAGYHTRRGFEKVIFNATIVFGLLFALSSLLVFIIK